MEQLERRHLLAIVPIDAMVGVPFDGLVATDLRLPDYATGHDLVQVLAHGQRDYSPRVVLHDDGTFDLYASFVFQRGGTEGMSISFRNDRTGRWDVLESGSQTVRPSHFDAQFPDTSIFNRVPGTLMRDPVATLTSTELAQPLDRYTVEIDWLGQTKSGRLVRQEDGSVTVFVNDAYIPVNDQVDGEVTVAIRLAGAAADAPIAGFARAYLSGSYGSIGFGAYYGERTSDTTFRIDLPNVRNLDRGQFHIFVPATESDGWPSTFTAELTWQYRDDTVANTTATVVRNRDGSYALHGELPAGVKFDNGMMRVRETISRPAVDGAPAQTYTVEYVGSFNLIARRPEENPPPAEAPPDENGGGAGHPVRPGDESTFTALAGGDRFGRRAIGFESIGTSLFSDDDAQVGSDHSDDGVPEPTTLSG